VDNVGSERSNFEKISMCITPEMKKEGKKTTGKRAQS
jgi:hypothetical protein